VTAQLIIGVDPGVTTGLAWGVFSPQLRNKTSLWKALARGRQLGCEQIVPPFDVGAKLIDVLADASLRGFDKQHMHVCIEDFQVRQNLAGGTGRDKLAPVYVTGVIDAMLNHLQWYDITMLFMPGEHKSLATDKRIKMWAQSTSPPGRAGWVRGKRHTRDAWRLVAAGLNTI
jgi:hypothetical protein